MAVYERFHIILPKTKYQTDFSDMRFLEVQKTKEIALNAKNRKTRICFICRNRILLRKNRILWMRWRFLQGALHDKTSNSNYAICPTFSGPAIYFPFIIEYTQTKLDKQTHRQSQKSDIYPDLSVTNVFLVRLYFYTEHLMFYSNITSNYM